MVVGVFELFLEAGAFGGGLVAVVVDSDVVVAVAADAEAVVAGEVGGALARVADVLDDLEVGEVVSVFGLEWGLLNM